MTADRRSAPQPATKSRSVGGALIAEFVEVETGKRQDRPKRAKALAVCRLHNATLIIARLDRLARNTRFLLSIVPIAHHAPMTWHSN